MSRIAARKKRTPKANPAFAPGRAGGPTGVLERQADRAAEKAMENDGRAGAVPGHIAAPTAPAATVSGVCGVPDSVRDVLSAPGRALEESLRERMQAHFGHDFSRVRIHADNEAADSAREIDANAYTLGQHIVFARGRFSPGTDSGRRLLAHELAHVVQQSGGARFPGLAAAPGPLLQREAATPEAKPKEKVELKQLRYVCIFVGNDLYGTQARRFVKLHLPEPEHHLIEAKSMQDAMIRMRDHSRQASADGTPARIDEVVLVAHGNATGFVQIPMIPGRKGTTPEELATLQEEFRSGAHKTFQAARSEVIGLFDDDTDIIVRGCRVGRNQAAVDGLAAFFGGQARVYAAKEYQAFTRRRVASFDEDATQAAIKAFDHLAMQGFVPKDAVSSDEDKVRWVAAHLPDRFVPESFLVDEADVAKFRGASADSAAIQSLKDYLSAQLIGVDKWGQSAPARAEDPELDRLSADAIVAIAAKRLAALRKLEKESPEDWKAIGENAWWVYRCHNAWSRTSEATEIDRGNRDPVAGLTMPGLNYDTNVLGGQAAKRPDLRIKHSDAFATATLAKPVVPTSEEVEDSLTVDDRPAPEATPGATPEAAPEADRQDPGAAPGKPPVADERDAAAPARQRPGTAPAAKPAPDPEMQMPEDRITPNEPMPEPPIGVDLDKGQPAPAKTALVLRGEFKRQFEIPFERQIGYLKVRKAVVEFNGRIDFKSEGSKELVIGALGTLASKPGETVSGAGSKMEGTIAEGRDKQTGASAKVTGGLDIGGQGRTNSEGDDKSTARGLKSELYITGQVAWGPLAQELKLVVIGMDETKSGTNQLTILGIRWSPIIVHGSYELPVSDGTKVRFTGMTKLTIEAEPDWARISARLAQALGRQVVISAGAAAVGGTSVGVGAATAVGGAAVGELVIIGGFVAAAAALVYAYYKSAEEIEDLKELQRGADQAVADFVGGYLSEVGLPAGGNPGGAFWSEGGKHGRLQLEARLRRAARVLNERYPGADLTEKDPELREAVLAGIKQDEQSWRLAVSLSYETAIRTMFYRAWQARVAGTMAARNDLYARARVGLASVAPNDQPDHSWVNDVGRNAGTGRRLPSHVR